MQSLNQVHLSNMFMNILKVISKMKIQEVNREVQRNQK
jgi:hypothetical protein